MKSMKLHGGNLIGNEVSREGSALLYASDPVTGETLLSPAFVEATPGEVDRAVRRAEGAFETYAALTPPRRASFLRVIADCILELGALFLERAHAETALPSARLEAERGRTVSQILMFADLVEEGSWVDARIDPARPDRKPTPRPDIRRMLVPLGPVAVFGASNFPLAFSVAGGDTISALAAGCPVIVKAHPAHPGTSELAGRAVQLAASQTGMPDGVFSMLHGAAHEVGRSLVTHPLVKAVGFTGSLAAGRALFDAAARRDEPIPVYAEMGSSNPVFVLPDALVRRGAEIARGLAASVTLGAGQFCTNPGLTVLERSETADRFLAIVGETLAASPTGTMATAGIKAAYDAELAAFATIDGVELAAHTSGAGANPQTDGAAALLVADAATYGRNPRLARELYGPATLAVRCASRDEVLDFARALGGHLTATIHATERDLVEYADLLAILRRKVGRLIVNGFPTGVEVSHAMHHGGPYPATTDPRATSVGSAAVQRFARPMCFQDFPDAALPEELREANPRRVWRLVDGELTRGPR
jgi:alpha-ketoglutaric semialdehyde dehydrogenase